MRIINLEKFLKEMSFADGVRCSIRLKITDRFIKTNNIIIGLSIKDNKMLVKPSKEYDIELSIEDLTSAIFTGRGDQRLSFLFPSKKMVCFDKF